ncbi:LysR family transcriptional regulator [Fluviibacterium sp. DFM31]|uniref:LysR family transcriptional regulator n=1 Tax=Meridianimarinicoccus marinus TaxID=3231483 RepID=A0ABV3LBG1_9RHOB
METQHIRFVREVAARGNISSAARELGLTQPALTKIISRVEDLVGAQLFDRGPRGVSLTPLGQLFLERMERVEREMHNLSSDIRARQQGITGTVSIAAGQFWLGRILPKVVTELHRKAPGIHLRIKTGTREELLHFLRSGQVDMMLGRITRDMPEDLIGEELAELRMMLIARANHPLAQKDTSVTHENLRHYGCILPPRDDPSIRYAFTSFGLEPPPARVEAVSRQFIDRLLVSSDLLTVVPAIKGRDIGPELTRLRADWLTWASSAGIMLVRDRSLLPCCHVFLDVLRAEMAHQES